MTPKSDGSVPGTAETSTELITRAVAAFGLSSSGLTLPPEPLDPPDWSRLVTEVSSERLLGLLSAAVEAGAMPVTTTQRDEVSGLATDAVRYCLALEGELLRTGALLAAAGVPMRVLKGPAAAALDYPERALRSFVDIDLLVRSADFDIAVQTLTAAAYVREHPQPRPGFDRRFSKGTSFVTPHRLAIDLHRTFVMGPLGLRIDLADLWDADTPFQIGSTTFLALSTEARLLHACYHAMLGDRPPRMLPQRDIAQILLSGACDERRVRELSQRWQGEAVLAAGVASAWRLLRVEQLSPLASWATTRRPSAAEQHELDLYQRADPTYAALSVGAVRAVPGWRDKLAFLHALALPDRDYVAGRYRSPLARLARGLGQVARRTRRP